MNLPEFSIWIFTAGLAGALAPEIIRLYKIKNNPELFKWSWFYLIISLLFILLGGFVAWILPTTSLWGAFYAGVSLPIIISSIGKSKKLIESEKSSEKEEVFLLKRENEKIKVEFNNLRNKFKEIEQFLPPEERRTLKEKETKEEETDNRLASGHNISRSVDIPFPSGYTITRKVEEKVAKAPSAKVQFSVPKEKLIDRVRYYLRILFQE